MQKHLVIDGLKFPYVVSSKGDLTDEQKQSHIKALNEIYLKQGVEGLEALADKQDIIDLDTLSDRLNPQPKAQGPWYTPESMSESIPSPIGKAMAFYQGAEKGNPVMNLANKGVDLLREKLGGEKRPSLMDLEAQKNPSYASSGQSMSELAHWIGLQLGLERAGAPIFGRAQDLPIGIKQIAQLATPLARGAVGGGTIGATTGDNLLDTERMKRFAKSGMIGEGIGLVGNTLTKPVLSMQEEKVLRVLSQQANIGNLEAQAMLRHLESQIGPEVNQIASLPEKTGVKSSPEGMSQAVGGRAQSAFDVANARIGKEYETAKTNVLNRYGEDKSGLSDIEGFANTLKATRDKEMAKNPDIAKEVDDIFNELTKNINEGPSFSDLMTIQQRISEHAKGRGEWRGVFGKLNAAANDTLNNALAKVATPEESQMFSLANKKYSMDREALDRVAKLVGERVAGVPRERLPSQATNMLSSQMTKSPEFIDTVLGRAPEMKGPLSDSLVVGLSEKAKNTKQLVPSVDEVTKKGVDFVNTIDQIGPDRLKTLLPEKTFKEVMGIHGRIKGLREKIAAESGKEGTTSSRMLELKRDLIKEELKSSKSKKVIRFALQRILPASVLGAAAREGWKLGE